MKNNIKYLVLGSAAVVAMSMGTAYANDHGFTSHHLVPKEPYAKQAKKLPADEKLELREYLNYETREPCQGYQTPPQPFIEDGCGIKAEVIPPPRPPREVRVETTKTTVVSKETELRPIIANYKIFFDHDRHNIRESEQATLNKVSADIKKHAPYEVTVAGYADRSGPSDYNIVLSQSRAESVSRTLTGMGIPNRVLAEEAHGENDLAVQTPDGVRLEDNRRVEIQFRK